MKNVLHFANYKASYKGNFIESLKLLDKKLKNEGSNAVYCFPKVEKSTDAHYWMEEIEKDCGKVYNFTDDFMGNVKFIKEIIKTEQIGIIHVHFFTMPHILAIRAATVGTNMKIIMHFHNHSAPANGMKGYLRQRLYAKAVMIACSDSVYRGLERDYPKNEKYAIDNGVKFDRLDKYSYIDRTEYGLTNDSRLLLIFGFDYYRKGVDIAIDALKMLNKDNAAKYELILSLSKNANEIENKILSEHGEIPSWLKIISSRSDVASLYNMCDVFISPSREEGLPYSVIEASYCLCSVVVSDIPPQKCLQEIPYMVYHKAGDAKSLKESIEKALSQHQKRTNDIEAIRGFLRKNYSIDKWTESIMDIYNKVW